jgi:hypothetical protein
MKRMIIIKTKKWNKVGKEYIYKDYEVIDSLKTAMNEINNDRENNDLVKNEPIEIYDIVEE